MHLSVALTICFSVVLVAVMVKAAPKDNLCCVDQPPPKIVVEKTGTQTRYRQATANQRYYTDCGLFGWSSCTRYRTYTFAQSYSVDIYKQRSIPQDCKKYACCEGYVMVKDICYGEDELKTVVNHVADIKDGLSDIGDVDLKDVIGVVHDVVG